MDLYVPSFSDFYVIADSNDWGFSNSDIGSRSGSGITSLSQSSGSVEEEKKPEQVKLNTCEQIKRAEIIINDLLHKDPRFLASKGMTHEDLEQLRYEIKKDHPELSKDAFSGKNVLEHVWPKLLATGFRDLPTKASNAGTDDRRDDDFTLSINTVTKKVPDIGKHHKKPLKVENKSHLHKREDIVEEEKTKDEKLLKERLSVERAGKLYLKKFGGHRFEKFEDEIGHHITEMERRRLSRALWHNQIEGTKPVLPLPSLIRKFHTVKREEMKKKLGPGTYDPDYYHEIQCAKRNLLTRGVLTVPNERFPNDTKKRDDTPQPEYINPYTELEKAEDRYKHPCRKTLFAGARRCFRKAKTTGTSIGPGTYNFKSSIQEVLDKKISKRGPYDFSEPRDRIMYGYNKTRKIDPDVGPGHYFNFDKETMDTRLNSPSTKYKGKFNKLRPDDLDYQTGERNLMMAPMAPSAKTRRLPGPGAYTIKSNIGTRVKDNKYPFNITAPARIIPKWSDEHEVDPTRYRVWLSDKLLSNIKGNGMKSNFKNKAPARLPYDKYPMATERLRGKDIPREEIRRRLEQ